MPWYWLWMLILGAVLLGGASAGARVLSGHRPGSAWPGWSGLLLGAVVVGLVFAVCLLSRHPFLPGSQLGYGALLGFGASMLAVVAIRIARPGPDIASRAAASAGAAGAAVLWVATTEIVFSGDPTPALLGGLAGGLLALTPVLWSSREPDDGALSFFALGLLVLGLGAVLSVERYNTHLLRPYWALPAIAYAGGLLGAVAGALLFGRTRAARWGIGALAAIVAGALWFGMAALLRQRGEVSIEPRLAYLLGLGLIAFALAGLAASTGRERLFGSVAVPLLGVILIVIGFNLGGASGLAVALAVGLPLSLALAPEERSREAGSAALWLALLGALYLAYRLFLARFGDEFHSEATLEFGRHYVLAGLAAGLLWTAVARGGRFGPASGLAQAGAVVVLPTALFIVFGYQVLLGLLLGFWVAQLLLPTSLPLRWSWRGTPVSLFPLVAVWALILPNLAFFMLDQARWVRGAVIGCIVFVAVLLLGLLRRAPADAPAGEPSGE